MAKIIPQRTTFVKIHMLIEKVLTKNKDDEFWTYQGDWNDQVVLEALQKSIPDVKANLYNVQSYREEAFGKLSPKKQITLETRVTALETQARTDADAWTTLLGVVAELKSRIETLEMELTRPKA